MRLLALMISYNSYIKLTLVYWQVELIVAHFHLFNESGYGIL